MAKSKREPGTEFRSDAAGRRRRFVDEYLIDLNGVRAYFAAFGRTVRGGKPRSYRSACVESSKLLRIPAVRRELHAAQLAFRQRCGVTAEKVIRELAAVAFSDLGDHVDYTVAGLPQPKPARDVSALARKALRSVKRRTRTLADGETVQDDFEIAMHDKVAALALLYRHLGLDDDEPQLLRFLNALPQELRQPAAKALGLDDTGSAECPETRR